ncbi:hypothetical protein EMQ25_04230 [Arsenicitalea aurantiaca]|uniref:Argininosuccinate lyase n=1 Tax=Arsenicitalea aurantiaca TaxID=1783274 RepID=A0A433XM56_9HYPH|nr:hypothetical protein [Arsenicitalea aurantiaca]RUT35159.1 hypothetical protein EMQ25_04230 [Arsenicitalea aurantiaca]
MQNLFARAAMAGAAAFIFSTGAGLAEDRRVLIINETSFTIMEFYASSVDADTWEEDILGKDVLPAGDSVMMNIDDGTGACLFDFRAVFDDGDEAVKGGVNVCEIARFTFTD